MNALGRRLMSHLYGAVGLSMVVLLSAWLMVDFAELSRHFGRVGWHAVTPLYTMRGPVLLHRLIPLALVIGQHSKKPLAADQSFRTIQQHARTPV